ncbi:MAG: hypothetical protein HQM10_20770 [Candidatus Riflebacteria bacterium]|nr:hypothetical protein [Candidatus Riflebacteria bacterium]
MKMAGKHLYSLITQQALQENFWEKAMTRKIGIVLFGKKKNLSLKCTCKSIGNMFFNEAF